MAGDQNHPQTKPTSGPTYAPSYVGQPKYVSKLFWDEFLKGEGATIRKQMTTGMDALQHTKEDVKQEIFRRAQAAWWKLPPERQEQWHEQDKKGSPYPPGSPGWAAEKQEEDATSGLEADLAAIDALDLDQLGSLAEQAAAGDLEAQKALEEAFAKIKDPEFQEYVGDYISQAAEARVSDATLAQQQKEFDKLSALTDPTITAAERKMMLDARKKQESDLRSQREAYANQLQARGMYGSGAEMTMNLGSAQEYANRRMSEEMEAQANAQNRAMEALTQANTVAGNIRTSEAQETQFRATAADKASEFNKKLKQEYDTWRTDAEDRVNKSKADRAKTIADFQRGTVQNKFRNTVDTVNTGLRGAETRSNVRTAGQRVIDDARKRLGNVFLFEKGQ